MITAYVKPTNFCNVGCTHCYLPVEVRSNKGIMSMDTVQSVAEMLADMASRRNDDFVHILWHGGEPLTISVDWYEAAGSILDSVLPGHIESIQTSLIPLRDEHIPLIHNRFSSFIGTSIDFSQRKIQGSVESYSDLWLKKVEKAREAGITVVPGVVPTISDVSSGGVHNIVSFMERYGFPEFNFERYNHFGIDNDDVPSNMEHSQFLVNLYKEIMPMVESGKAPVINVLRAGINGVFHASPGDRWGTTCSSDFIVIEPDGSTNNCPDKAMFEKSFSNVSDGYPAFSSSPKRIEWIRNNRVAHKTQACSDCRFNSWCGSGCPITTNGDSSSECSGYKTFLDLLERDMKDARARSIMGKYIHTICAPKAVQRAA